ncbi:MAG TPA: CPBP family intramembrane glutamic endopeptidase [Bdellovibrio sp.]|nr:CPBP family intramembrane glutamic endopeptidase [Bdellovibrio sp.]
MIHHGGIENIAMDFLLMWTPGIVGLILSLLFSKNVKDIGFKFGRLKFYGLAYAIPALTAILILFSLILLGQGQFEVSPKLVESKGSVGKAVAVILLIGPTLSVLIGFVSALGEEIGWRGFLHSRMMALKIPHPFLITGIIWSIWHWPLILFSNYATSSIPLLSLFLFSCVIISFAIIIGWLREASGSVLVAGLAHSVHNAWMQAIYPAFLKKGPLDEFLGGESGVLNAVIYIFIAIYVYRRFLVRGRETTGNVLLPVDPSLNG